MSTQFWATVCKTVRRMLSDSLSVLPCPVLSIMLVNYGQTVGWIKMNWYGGKLRPKRHYVRWEPSSPFPKQGPQFSAHVYCGQTAAWIKMPLGMEVGLDPGHIVLDGYPALPFQKRHSPVIFGPYLWPNGRPSQLLLSTCSDVIKTKNVVKVKRYLLTL